jgi:hypothetical protein
MNWLDTQKFLPTNTAKIKYTSLKKCSTMQLQSNIYIQLTSMKMLCMKIAQANYITIKSGRERLDAPKRYDSITENE